MEKERLDRLSTFNMMGKGDWEQRRSIMEKEFIKNGLTSDNGVIMGFQEVSAVPFNTMVDLAKSLGFSPEECYFFPTVESRDYGIGIITNLKVERVDYAFFTFDPTDPNEFGTRGLGLLELASAEGPIIAGVTHFSVSELMQYQNAAEAISNIKLFAQASSHFSPVQGRHPEKIKDFCTDLKIVVLGDFNAEQHIPLYQLIESEGLRDLTVPLHLSLGKDAATWPSNVEWYIEIHKRQFEGKDPPFDVKKLRRWMDYVFSCGLEAKKVKLMGEKPKKGMYMSDHFGIVIYL